MLHAYTHTRARAYLIASTEIHIIYDAKVTSFTCRGSRSTRVRERLAATSRIVARRSRYARLTRGGEREGASYSVAVRGGLARSRKDLRVMLWFGISYNVRFPTNWLGYSNSEVRPYSVVNRRYLRERSKLELSVNQVNRKPNRPRPLLVNEIERWPFRLTKLIAVYYRARVLRIRRKMGRTRRKDYK